MSEFNPTEKTKETVSKCLKICEENGLSVQETLDTPAELQRQIQRSIRESNKRVFRV